MRKIGYGIRRLMTEYRGLYKPDRKTLVKDTARIAGTTFFAAAVLKLADTGFAALLALVI